MVKKLFKHEIASYLRLVLPVYIILLSVGAMGRIIQFFEADDATYYVVRGSSVAALVISIFAAVLLTGIFCIVRFYKNLFSGEGYLTLTLPVTTTQHVFTKLTVALLVNVATFLTILLSLCLFFAGDWLAEIVKAGVYLLNKLTTVVSVKHLVFYVIEIFVLLLVCYAMELLLYYMCISVGQTSRKNRIMAAIGFYFLLYIVTQILSTVLITSLSSLDLPFIIRLGTWIARHPFASIHIFLCGAILFTLALSVVYFAVTHFILHKKLNLE